MSKQQPAINMGHMIPQLRLFILIAIALLALILFSAILFILSIIFWIISQILPAWFITGISLTAIISAALLLKRHRRPLLKKIKNYFYLIKRDKYASMKLPKNRRQAAEQSLNSIDRLIERLQDDVVRKILIQEKQRVEKELNRGDLVVVVFGTGSSGKTSLIRALLNEIVGNIGAPMGSTRSSQTYRLRLRDFDRGVQLTDTPGILEAGKDGRNREQEAREQATRADLMVVVVDSDLRAAELETIRSLNSLGKRLLLALNKCDLRGEEEEKRLLSILRTRCKKLLAPEDVVAVSASPQTIPRPGQFPLQPPPEIDALLNRIANVLHDDGEELLADNILLQCRNLGNTGRNLLNKQRQKKARSCVDRYSWISGGVVAANPLPAIDLIGTAAVNAQMVIEIARVYGVNLNPNRAQELTVSVGKTLAGLGIVKGGVSIISNALRLNLPAFLVTQAAQGVAAAWLTRVAGASFITYFQQNQDWGDGGVQEVVQRHYQLNKRETSLNDFLKTALKRVIEPLKKENKKKELPPFQRLQEEEGAWDHEHLKNK